MDLQSKKLQNDFIKLAPLKVADFDPLFKAASDALIWDQHPNPLRYKLEYFAQFFEGAIASKGAFVIKDIAKNQIIGSTRFYDYNQNQKFIYIGYTFIAREFWGKGYNFAIKTQMLHYAFKFVDKVFFQIGASNFRSQKAINKIGAIKLREEQVQYYNEESKLNYIYVVEKRQFLNQFKPS